MIFSGMLCPATRAKEFASTERARSGILVRRLGHYGEYGQDGASEDGQADDWESFLSTGVSESEVS